MHYPGHKIYTGIVVISFVVFINQIRWMLVIHSPIFFRIASMALDSATTVWLSQDQWNDPERCDQSKLTLRWRHNGCDGLSNHQPHDCLHNRLFRRRSKKTASSASLAFVRGIHRGPVNSPHKWPVTRKMFPFDDVIMDAKPQENIAIRDANFRGPFHKHFVQS